MLRDVLTQFFQHRNDRLDVAAHQLDEVARDGESEPGALLGPAPRLGLSEGLEEDVELGRGDAGAGDVGP